MNNWEKRTPYGAIVRKQEQADKGISFEQKAERYRGNAERVVEAEKLTILVRGFITGCGGIDHVKGENCELFVKDHSGVIRKAMDTVPEEDLALAVYALVTALEGR